MKVIHEARKPKAALLNALKKEGFLKECHSSPREKSSGQLNSVRNEVMQMGLHWPLN